MDKLFPLSQDLSTLLDFGWEFSPIRRAFAILPNKNFLLNYFRNKLIELLTKDCCSVVSAFQNFDDNNDLSFYLSAYLLCLS